MVLKFDHISYVAERKNKGEILSKLEQPVFCEKNLINLDIKFALMKKKQVDHDLYFFDSEIPTEYIFYEYISGESGCYLENGIMYGGYYNKENALYFLKGIFGKNVIIEGNEIVCNIRGILDKRDFYLILRPLKEKNISTFLDGGGYGTIAIMCNGYFDKVPKDGICTEHRLLKVNGKILDICFTKSDSVNIIIEIIMVKG